MVALSRSLCCCAILCLLAASAAVAALPVHLQLGSVPHLPDGGGWSIAAPLGVAPGACSLESGDPSLRLITSPDGSEAWLALEPTAIGPAFGLLEIESDGVKRHIAVAGEVVASTLESLPSVLVVSADGSGTERRYLRFEKMPRPTTCALDRARTDLGAPIAGGWIPLDVRPGMRVDESRGWIRWSDGTTRTPLQYSVLESITVLARAELPSEWTHESLLRFGETLEETGLRARVALLGRRAGVPALGLRKLGHDRWSGIHGFEPRYFRPLPDLEGFEPLSAVAVQIGDRALGRRARRARLVTLGGETAALWDPGEGLMARGRAAGLRASRATARSRLARNSLFAVRTDLRSGRHYLRRWRAAGDGGQYALRGRIAELPLERRLGVNRLRPFALRARRNEAQWPETPISESLLLLAATDGFAKADAPVGLFTLLLDPENPSRILSARRSFRTRLRWAEGAPAPYLSYAEGQLAGQGGFPARAEVGIPDLTPGRYIDIRGVGSRFSGSPYVESVRHQVDGGAFGFEVPVFMGIDQVENRSFVRRYRVAENRMIPRASGNLGEVRGLAMKPSARMRHAWAVTRDLEGVRRLRLLTNGTPPGVNLPPLIDAGPDLRSRRALVELRARAFDPNGDPLAIRWSAPGVEFGNPGARATVARFPVGTTQVRVALRESQGVYGAVDVMNVTVQGPSGLGDAPGLSTRITGLFPNPANPRLRIAFTLDRTGPVRITVHDVAGRVVRRVLDEVRPTGAYDIDWDGRDDAGQAVASGVYLVRLETGDRTDTRRGVIVR